MDQVGTPWFGVPGVPAGLTCRARRTSPADALNADSADHPRGLVHSASGHGNRDVGGSRVLPISQRQAGPAA